MRHLGSSEDTEVGWDLRKKFIRRYMNTIGRHQHGQVGPFLTVFTWRKVEGDWKVSFIGQDWSLLQVTCEWPVEECYVAITEVGSQGQEPRAGVLNLPSVVTF